MIRRFLYDQIYPDHDVPGSEAPLAACPSFNGRVFIHHNATATFYAPSDISGIRGMRQEFIRAMPLWRGGSARNDCIFLEKDPTLNGFQGLYVAQVSHFLSFRFHRTRYPCAIVRWFIQIGEEPCPDTGMWRVAPEIDDTGNRTTSIIHLDSALRGAHLIGLYGDQFLPRDFEFSDALEAFNAYFVNKFADHNSNEIAF
jgi:hypothetical protein